MGTKLVEIREREEIQKGVYKHFHNVVKDGSCQCYKDCDCCLDNGKIIDEINRFSHSGSGKMFATLESCLQSIKSYL